MNSKDRLRLMIVLMDDLKGGEDEGLHGSHKREVAARNKKESRRDGRQHGHICQYVDAESC